MTPPFPTRRSSDLPEKIADTPYPAGGRGIPGGEWWNDFSEPVLLRTERICVGHHIPGSLETSAYDFDALNQMLRKIGARRHIGPGAGNHPTALRSGGIKFSGFV